MEDESEVQNLSSIFQEGLDLYNSLEKLDEPTNSPNFQIQVKKAMRILEQATQLVSLADLFSRNETIDEIATTDLQYLLLPALLGGLSLKLTGGDRKTIIDVADVYYKDFLQRCNEYGLSNYEFKDQKAETVAKADGNSSEAKSEFEQLRVSVNTRANKIQRFNEQKDLKQKLQDLKVNLENEHVDEDIKRKYFLTMIKLFIYEAIDELNSIEMEKPILEHMANMSKEEQAKPPKRPPVQPLRPIIITRDKAQKAVYGAGYPSLPTMTVQEFYEKRVQDGIFPDPDAKKTPEQMSLQEASLAGISLNNDDKEAEEKERAVDEDDPENLERMRSWDEFKDDHRRGWGNRMNRS